MAAQRCYGGRNMSFFAGLVSTVFERRYRSAISKDAVGRSI